MKMKIKTIFFSLLLFFVASDVLAQGYPVIVPSATWTKPDGTEEEGETMSSAAPLIGHFLALTRTRWTNMAFYAIVAIVLITTGINLWM